jgi:hypothetical protein
MPTSVEWYTPENLALMSSMVLSSPITNLVKDQLGQIGKKALDTARDTLSQRLGQWFGSRFKPEATPEEKQAAIQADLQQNPSHATDLKTLLEQHGALLDLLKAQLNQPTALHNDFQYCTIGLAPGTKLGTVDGREIYYPVQCFSNGNDINNGTINNGAVTNNYYGAAPGRD